MKTRQKLEVVSQCPSCGAPIYGHKTISVGEQPEVRKSCVCVAFMPVAPATGPFIAPSVPTPFTAPCSPWPLPNWGGTADVLPILRPTITCGVKIG